MGYNTDFQGSFTVEPPLSVEQCRYLKAFASTRRMERDAVLTASRSDPIRAAVGLLVGEDGAYFVGEEDFHGQRHSPDVVNYNRPGGGQPSLWCRWVPTDDGTGIEVDEDAEKFDYYTEWLVYLIEHFIGPWGCTVNGSMRWRGEDFDDIGTIEVKDNRVRAVKASW